MASTNYKVLLTILLLVLLAQARALADGNTQTIGVSCIIPAIPGVNAAPDEKQLIKEQAVLEERDMPAQQNSQQEPSTIIAEDTQEARAEDQDEISVLALVKTIYNR